MKTRAFLRLFFCVGLFCGVPAESQGIEREGATLYLDFEKDGEVELVNGAKVKEGKFGKALEFTSALQYAEVAFSKRLDGVSGVTVGGWFFPWRRGEQAVFFRGLPQIEERGNRLFRRETNWVNFVLGTDERGFMMGTINGNGTMPFPHVTVSEVPFDAWQQ